MPEQPRVVVNTGPLLALIAAVGDLSPLRKVYDEVIVPLEPVRMREVLARMRACDIWVSDSVAETALDLSICD